MRGEFWSHFLVDLLQRWIGVAGVEVLKSALCAVEQTAGAFQGHNGVVECWLFRVVCHHFNFFELIAHAGLDRHFGLGLTAGLRDATGFKRTIGTDTPLVFDAGASIRYAF